jgi:hypothetical protein
VCCCVCTGLPRYPLYVHKQDHGKITELLNQVGIGDIAKKCVWERRFGSRFLHPPDPTCLHVDHLFAAHCQQFTYA